MTAVVATSLESPRASRSQTASGRNGPPGPRRLHIPQPGRLPVPAHELQGGKVDGALVARAVWEDQLLEACRYIRNFEVAQGLLEPGSDEPCVGLAEAMPETALFVARAGEEILAAQRVVVEADALELPSDSSFALEIRSLRGRGRRLCEASPPATMVTFQKSDLLSELLRCSVAHCISMSCTDLIVAVEPWDAESYSQLGFQRVGKERMRSSHSPFPAVLMVLRVDSLTGAAAPSGSAAAQSAASLRDLYLGRNPYQRCVAVWSDLAEGAFDDAVFLREVFARHGGLPSRCDAAQLASIRRRWGARLFDQVFPPRPVNPLSGRAELSDATPALSAEQIDSAELESQMVSNQRG
jgi:N-acyl amino acid synthase FeeM